MPIWGRDRHGAIELAVNPEREVFVVGTAHQERLGQAR